MKCALHVNANRSCRTLLKACLPQAPRNPGNVTVTLRNIMHGKMQPIPASVSPACADVIRKALTRSAKARITLDKLADHPWVTSGAKVFQQDWAGDVARRLPSELAFVAKDSRAAIGTGQLVQPAGL